MVKPDEPEVLFSQSNQPRKFISKYTEESWGWFLFFAYHNYFGNLVFFVLVAPQESKQEVVPIKKPDLKSTDAWEKKKEIEDSAENNDAKSDELNDDFFQYTGGQKDVDKEKSTDE